MAMPRLKKRNQHCPDVWKVFYFSVLILTKVTVATKQCARFDFPTLSSNLTITAGKGSVVTFPFELQTDQCPGDTSQPHHVYVKGPSSNHDYCVVRLADRTCSNVVNENHCPCKDSGGAAVFNKTVTDVDSGLWTWRTGDGVSKSVDVAFNILIAPSFNHDVISTTASNNFDDTLFSTRHNEGFTDVAVEKSVDQDNEAGNDGTKTNKANQDGDDNHDKKQMVDDSNITKEIEDADEDDDEDDDGEDPLEGSVITGVIFVCANIVTIVVVAFIVVTVRKRRKRKREGVVKTTVPARRRPNATLPLPPSNGQYDVTTPKRQEQEHQSRTSHNYLSLQGRLSSRIYDEIPAGKERASESYLTPVSLQARASQNAYDVVV